MSKENRLDESQPFATTFGQCPYAFEQNGHYFNHAKRRVTEDGKLVEDAEAPVRPADLSDVDTDTPPAKKKPGPKKIDVDPKIPYEDHEKAPMAALRARYTFVTKGKKARVGTSKKAIRQLIIEAKQAAAGISMSTVGKD